jgi:hypothetical protein
LSCSAWRSCHAAPSRLAGRRAARGEHGQTGRGAQQLADQRRGLVDDLEVVEQQQDAAAAEEGLDGRGGRLVALRAELEHAGDRVGHEPVVGDWREVGEVDAVGERIGQLVPGLQREPRLADPARSGQRDQPRARCEQRAQLGQVRAPPDQRRLGRRQPARRDRREVEARVLAEDRLLELLQRRPRLQPQRVTGLAHALERLQRGGLAAASVLREHQLPAEPLAAGVLRRERLQLGRELAVAAERQVRLHPVLQRGQPELLEPRHLGLRERLIAHVLVRRPAPQSQRLVPLPAGGERLEALEVQLTGLEPQPVPGRLAHDPLRPEPPPQRVHLDLERVRRRRRRLLAPQRVDQAVARRHLPAGHQQARQQRDLPARCELHRSGSGDDLHGAEHAELHERPILY